MLVKNTNSLSNIDDLVKALIEEKKSYHLGVLGKVEAIGIHDIIDLRILIYHGGVVLEQIRRLNDVDEKMDDIIISTCFNYDQVPEKFPLEHFVDYFDYTDCKEFQNYKSTICFIKYIQQFLK